MKLWVLNKAWSAWNSCTQPGKEQWLLSTIGKLFSTDATCQLTYINIIMLDNGFYVNLWVNRFKCDNFNFCYVTKIDYLCNSKVLIFPFLPVDSDEAMLEQALAMSMHQTPSSAAQETPMPDFNTMTEEEQIAYAMQMSLQADEGEFLLIHSKFQINPLFKFQTQLYWQK